MSRHEFMEKVPSLSIIIDRLTDEQARLKVSIYSRLFLVIFVLITGMTLVLSGLVLIPMMAFAYEMLAVVGASMMVAMGVVITVASYIWLTSPA